jgi:tetratricopeptide (TPR) repeat protein
MQYVGLESHLRPREGVAHLNVAYALQALGDLEVRTGQLAEAEARYEEALPIFRTVKSRLDDSKKFRGGLFVRTDPPTEAEVRLAESLTLMSLRDLYVTMGRRGEAERRYEEALPYFRTMVRETLLDTSTGFRSGSLDRLMELRGRLGGETFDAIIQKIFELFPAEDLEIWDQVREKMQVAQGERGSEP